MGNRRYTLEQKMRFLDTYEKMGSVAGAARAVGILSREVCYSWVRKKDELRAGYKLSLIPHESLPQVKCDRSKIPLEEKVQCILAIDAGLSIHRVSLEFNKNLSSVQNWYRSKDELLALYYSQQHPSESDTSSLEVAWEVQMDKEQADKELVKKNKALAKENEYLKDKVAYLENLNKILKERTGPAKKKNISLQSSDASPIQDEEI